VNLLGAGKNNSSCLVAGNNAKVNCRDDNFDGCYDVVAEGCSAFCAAAVVPSTDQMSFCVVVSDAA